MVWMLNREENQEAQRLMRLMSRRAATIVALVALVWTTLLAGPLQPAQAAFLKAIPDRPWEYISLNSEESPLGVGFSETDPNHGWIVGTNSSMFETLDGGDTWLARKLDLGTERYRLTSVSFSGNEGWVAGKPAILLHTEDGGTNWERMPLSEKLPGSPNEVFALGPDTAEMVTDVGAIYRTTDGARNWKALVNDAFGVFKSLHRSPDGQYVAVSSRGNFFSTWKPGLAAWEPYNRNSSRRLQGMGFTPDDRLWMLARGGQVQFTNSVDAEDWQKPQAPESFNSWGFLDLGYRTDEELWVVGGSGTLLVSYDNGKTWKKDGKVEDVPANLYKVDFVSPTQGYILGQRGTFLRYNAAAS
jgi:photosystem II stability/assembly factor-like uncharacterized protein